MLQTKTVRTARPELPLGWGLIFFEKEKTAKIWKKGERFQIVELRNGEKQYHILSFPFLSLSEAQVVKEVLEAFQVQIDKKTMQKTLSEFLQEFVEKNELELEADQAQYLLFVLEKLAFDWGPLGELLLDDSLEEIAVTGIGKENPVRVFHPVFGWLCTNLFFAETASVKNVVNRMARHLGRRLSMQTPRLNAVLENGSRIHAVMEPVALGGIALTIRKFRVQPFTPTDLLKNNTAESKLLAFLWLALQSDSTILIGGNTGSGKTTTLNALFCFVPRDERIIVVEETPEIRLPHAHQVRLSTSSEAGIDMHSLIVDSLRMRPDRMVVGEMRTAQEAKAFVDTLLAGQGKGSYATFHAQSSSEAIFRLKSMGVPEMDLSCIDLLMIQKRWTVIHPISGQKKEVRKIIELAELSWNGKKLETIPLVGFDFLSEKWEQYGFGSKAMKKIRQTFGWSQDAVEAEIKKRAELLEQAAKKEIAWKEWGGIDWKKYG